MCDITGVVGTLGVLMVIILPGRDRGIETLPTTDEVALWLDGGTGVESPLLDLAKAAFASRFSPSLAPPAGSKNGSRFLTPAGEMGVLG